MLRNYLTLLGKTVGLSVLFLILATPVTHAYLDPNAGSYILQITAAIIFGGLFIFKAWWQKVKDLLLNIVHRKDRKSSEKDRSKA